MKIYTKTGDHGITSLFGGKRVDKNSARIEAYGCVDELNSLIGTVVADGTPTDVLKKLIRIQAELFVLGTDLASPQDVKVKIPRITKAYIRRLEKEIDAMEKQLPKLKNFILPGGGKVGAQLHFARTVARQAERRIVDLSHIEKINQNCLIYINRLSDWLFVMARYVNFLEKIKEIPWKGRGK
jgi:cob(I)alamin adenosyltransferase